MEGVGTGWLAWTYDATLDTPMPAIERAYKARCAMLRAIFGGEDDPPPAKASRPMTTALFDALFVSKN